MKTVVSMLAGGLLMGAPLAAQEAGREANHLLGTDSPYLLQHLYNPVDWYPWGVEALEKARAEGKPVFVSVGYSACHWCYVMKVESFENEEIAAFLNANFVSVKIDREQRPDLDEQFMLVTQKLAGSGGWPNSVFLTSAGEPFFAGGYFPPEAFLETLERVAADWHNDRKRLEQDATVLGDYIRSYMSRSAAAKELTPEAVRLAVSRTLADMDEFNGGLGHAPKFPLEPYYLLLLDQAVRDGDTAMLEAVTTTLDGMLKGGIHDHAGGGFHRYAVDPEWQVPHFEKMLYNQALIGRLLVRAWAETGALRYRRAAERTFDYVLRELQNPAGGFYAAQDADSLDAEGKRAEGAYYVWTPAEIRAASDDAEFLIRTFNVTENGPFEGTNILYTLDLPAEAAGGDMAAYLARLDSGLAELEQARQKRPRPFTDRKIIVGWNAMMIATLAEASAVFGRPEYYTAAERAARYITETMQVDGVLKRTSIDDVPSIDGQLPDYAALGLAMVALYDFAPGDGGEWLQMARETATGMERFGEDDGSYRMTGTSDGLGVFRPLDDTEIPAGNALALALLAALAQRVDDPFYAQRATLLEAAIGGAALGMPVERAYTLKAAQDFMLGETGAVRYVSGGAVRIAETRTDGRLRLDIRLREGWHINAHEPLDTYFVATDLVVAGEPAPAGTYPEAVVKPLGFNPAPLALYEGEITLDVPLVSGETVLTLQACNDEICLSPEVVRFRVW